MSNLGSWKDKCMGNKFQDTSCTECSECSGGLEAALCLPRHTRQVSSYYSPQHLQVLGTNHCRQVSARPYPPMDVSLTLRQLERSR